MVWIGELSFYRIPGWRGDDDSALSFGVFGQVIDALNDEMVAGVHFGYSKESAELFDGEYGIEKVVDVLGVFKSIKNDSVNPLFMAGYSWVDVKNFTTLSGWKIAGGVSIGDQSYEHRAIIHAMLYLANYEDGDGDDWRQTGIQVGIGYRF